MRGGTAIMRAVPDAGSGLSPRARGNLLQAHVRDYHPGSIPACAGEPGCGQAAWFLRAVYPRVRGGTQQSLSPSTIIKGLSPRARGNHRPSRHGLYCDGSIPACAGEPLRRDSALVAIWVYPRVRGGTLLKG